MPGVFRRRSRYRQSINRRVRRFVITAASAALSPGVATFGFSGPGGIIVTAADATSGTPPYTYQWYRNVDGGSFTLLPNGGGVLGATTRTVTDASVTTGVLYGYKLFYTDAAVASVNSNVITAQLYLGGVLSGSSAFFRIFTGF